MTDESAHAVGALSSPAEPAANHPREAPTSASLSFDHSEAPTLEPSRPQPAGEPSAPAPALPERIGSFRIISVLDEGGMGVVYLAEQAAPKRKVALKVIRPGYATAAMMRRFELEAQVLGRLQHPGIAHVYDAGVALTPLGRQPYFAMELIEGRSLIEFMHSQSLSARDRLQLMVHICAAVQHAHAKGVIHRDLKPANILVTHDGQPKILDFGVARAIDSDVHAATMQTDIGQLVGTLPYMSPEQVAGDHSRLDTRSDVYALGVILYEALGGALPHDLDAKSLAVSIRTIAEREPIMLSLRNRALRGDIETIVHKALEKEPERRYQSAGDLAADIERYLHDEPIAARPSTAAYTISKFARRNKALVSGLACAATIGAAGVIGITWQAVVATSQRDRAVKAEGLAETRRIDAEKARSLAEQKAAIATATSNFLGSMLTSADREVTMDRNVPVRAVLADAAANADIAFRDQPGVEASVRTTLGDLYKNLGDYVTAQAQLRRALDLQTRSHGEDSREALEVNCSLIATLADAGALDEADALAQRTLTTTRAKFGERDAVTIAAMHQQARVLAERGETPASEKLLRDAIALGRDVLGEKHVDMLTMMHNLGTSLGNEGKLSEAEDLMKRTLALRSEVYGPDHLQTQYTRNGLATILQKENRLEEAEQLYRQTLEVRQRVLGVDHAATLTTLQNLANCLILEKKLEEAEPLARRTYEAIPRVLGDDHPKMFVAANTLAYLMEDLGKLDEAEQYYRRALELIQKKKGYAHPESFGPLNNLAMLQMRRGQLDDAETLFRDLVKSSTAALGESHFYVGIFRNNLGECLTKLHRLDEAEKELLASEATLEQALGAGHARTQKAFERLAALYEAKGDAAEAGKWKARMSTSSAP